MHLNRNNIIPRVAKECHMPDYSNIIQRMFLCECKFFENEITPVHEIVLLKSVESQIGVVAELNNAIV